jgi:hypothetical protein
VRRRRRVPNAWRCWYLRIVVTTEDFVDVPGMSLAQARMLFTLLLAL